MRDAVTTVCRGKYMVLSAYIRKEKRSKVNNLSLYHRELWKEEKFRVKIFQIKYKIKTYMYI